MPTSAPPVLEENTGARAGRGASASAISSLLDSILSTTVLVSQAVQLTQAAFLQERDLARSIAIWWMLNHADRPIDSIEQLLGQLTVDVGRIDQWLNDQTNEILHHPRLQKLEASWRGVWYLVDRLEEGTNTKIRLLDVSWSTLVRDLDRSIEFDQSQLFRKVYSAEFDTPGGEPYAVLLGDYEVHLHPSPDHPSDDLKALSQISEVAAAAFCPFITGAHPSLFGLDDFGAVERITNLPGIFEQTDYVGWRSLREKEDSRFLGLVLPRTLMREPYRDDNGRVDRFRFREELHHKSNYLWGSAVYAFGRVLMRAFADSGWLADIRGVRTDREDAGILTDLPLPTFETDARRVAVKPATDASILEMNEALLADLGFIPLCHCHGTEYSAFFSNASLQKPKAYLQASATANAKLSAMLQYMFCVSRVAHYVKVLGREKIGSLMDADQCARYLNDWLQKYVLSDDQSSIDVKAAHPLRQARVEVADTPGKPGAFRCAIFLQPHYQFDVVATTFKLTTEMVPAQR